MKQNFNSYKQKRKIDKTNLKDLRNYKAKLIKFQMNLTLYKTLFTHK